MSYTSENECLDPVMIPLADLVGDTSRSPVAVNALLR